jgi:preprotein translocase SecE subunit
VKKETAKVTWPGRDEVFGTTTVVIVYTALVGLFLFVVDAAITPLVNKLFSAFGS